MTRQVDGQHGETAVGESAGQGPPSVQVSTLSVHEHCPTIPLTEAQPPQSESARPRKFDGHDPHGVRVRRLASQLPTYLCAGAREPLAETPPPPALGTASTVCSRDLTLRSRCCSKALHAARRFLALSAARIGM